MFRLNFSEEHLWNFPSVELSDETIPLLVGRYQSVVTTSDFIPF